ncbi:alpha/beta fold hydrolase [Paenibacillus whitsoniae]|nr:alpha/beta hydrolase [Paenibacillus whitsoniae]
MTFTQFPEPPVQIYPDWPAMQANIQATYVQPAWTYSPGIWRQDPPVPHRDHVQSLTFVLIHGSWADASFWTPVAAELTRVGHTVYVPEYPGHGNDPNTNVSHSTMTKSIADFIIQHNLHDVILVGHSFGGSLVQTVSQLVPDRLKRLVFLNAFVIQDGGMLADEFPPAVVEQFQQLIKSSGNNTLMLPFPLFRETFTNLASLSDAQRIYNGVKPEPARPFFEKLHLKKFYALPIPKSYVHLLEDTAIPLGDPRYGWHPHMSSRLGLYRLIQLHGDHMSTTMLNGELVARKLYEAARD